MKNIALTIIMLFGTLFIVKADDNNTPVKSDIKKVTVFLSGAQVTRTATATIPIGQTDLVFEDLSQNINSNSIQVKGTGDFTILSVKHQFNYLKNQVKTKELIALEDSLESLNSSLLYQQSLLDVFNSEKNMIIANQSIGGSNTGVKIDDFKAAAEFFRTRLSEINLKTITTNSKIKKIQENITKVNSQLSMFNSKRNTPSSEIVVSISSKIRTTGTFEMSYTVTGASWYPSYDLRATDVNNPISLSYKANITQTTGEEWKNVKLTLSTGNPAQNSSKPIIYPWYLYVYNTYDRGKNKSYLLSGTTKTTNAPCMAKEEEKSGSAMEQLEMDASTGADYTTIEENATNFEFEISIPYTISSDGKTVIADIQNYTLPATYEYYCAPKLSVSAFLLAKVTGWEDYNLLSGNMNLYFEGTYVGKSYLNVKDTKDTLDFSLGVDDNIVIERKKQKDYSSKQLIGANRKVSYAWEISIRNKKKTPITIVVEDQVPLSTDKQIEIEKGETKSAKYDETTGIISWKQTIKSAETQKLNFNYTVKYPKDKRVDLE